MANTVYGHIFKGKEVLAPYREPALELIEYIPHLPVYAGFRCAICPIYYRKYESIIKHTKTHHQHLAKHFVREWYYFITNHSALQIIRKGMYFGINSPGVNCYMIPNVKKLPLYKEMDLQKILKDGQSSEVSKEARHGEMNIIESQNISIEFDEVYHEGKSETQRENKSKYFANIEEAEESEIEIEVHKQISSIISKRISGSCTEYRVMFEDGKESWIPFCSTNEEYNIAFENAWEKIHQFEKSSRIDKKLEIKSQKEISDNISEQRLKDQRDISVAISAQNRRILENDNDKLLCSKTEDKSKKTSLAVMDHFPDFNIYDEDESFDTENNFLENNVHHLVIAEHGKTIPNNDIAVTKSIPGVVLYEPLGLLICKFCKKSLGRTYKQLQDHLKKHGKSLQEHIHVPILSDFLENHHRTHDRLITLANSSLFNPIPHLERIQGVCCTMCGFHCGYSPALEVMRKHRRSKHSELLWNSFFLKLKPVILQSISHTLPRFIVYSIKDIGVKPFEVKETDAYNKIVKIQKAIIGHDLFPDFKLYDENEEESFTLSWRDDKSKSKVDYQKNNEHEFGIAPKKLPNSEHSYGTLIHPLNIDNVVLMPIEKGSTTKLHLKMSDKSNLTVYHETPMDIILSNIENGLPVNDNMFSQDSVKKPKYDNGSKINQTVSSAVFVNGSIVADPLNIVNESVLNTTLSHKLKNIGIIDIPNNIPDLHACKKHSDDYEADIVSNTSLSFAENYDKIHVPGTILYEPLGLIICKICKRTVTPTFKSLSGHLKRHKIFLQENIHFPIIANFLDSHYRTQDRLIQLAHSSKFNPIPHLERFKGISCTLCGFFARHSPSLSKMREHARSIHTVSSLEALPLKPVILQTFGHSSPMFMVYSVNEIGVNPFEVEETDEYKIFFPLSATNQHKADVPEALVIVDRLRSFGSCDNNDHAARAGKDAFSDDLVFVDRPLSLDGCDNMDGGIGNIVPTNISKGIIIEDDGLQEVFCPIPGNSFLIVSGVVLYEPLGLVICKTCRYSISIKTGLVDISNHLRSYHYIDIDINNYSHILENFFYCNYRSEATIARYIDQISAFNPIPYIKIELGYSILNLK
jgi:hypothetical protein